MGKSNFSEKKKAVSECGIQEEKYVWLNVGSQDGKTVDCSDM